MSRVQEEENIKVVVRIRPINDKEKSKGETSCVRCSSSSVMRSPGQSYSETQDEDNEADEVMVRVGPHDAQVYNCNRVFHPNVTQRFFFQECGLTGLLDSAIGGYRACAFAFGQTGAGKTYTIVGPGSTPCPDAEDDGILGSSLSYLFRKLESLGVQFKLRLSCMEIYKEQVRSVCLSVCLSVLLYTALCLSISHTNPPPLTSTSRTHRYMICWPTARTARCL